jgi:hypothetical protein
MHHRTAQSINVGRLARGCAAALLLLGLLPGRVFAQSDKWQIDAAPLYLWASEIDGRIGVNSRSVPVFMDFGDAVDHLSGSFTFHLEARKNRFGFLTDISFVRLSTESTFTTPILSRVVEGTAEVDSTIFEVGGSYLVSPDANFSVIGGLRTYSLASKLEFEGEAGTLTPVDESRTSADAFGGFTYRPKLSEKWTFLSRADIGAGEANFTWSGTIGAAYRFRPWGGLMFGYHALGIDTGDVGTLETPAGDASIETEYDVTHYGPFFSLTVHWAQK